MTEPTPEEQIFNFAKTEENPNEVELVQDSDGREYHKYVMCPTPGCNKKLVGSWKEYDTGEKENGLHVYQCPNCNIKFTINDVKVNAVPIPDVDGLGVIYNKNNYNVLFRVQGNTRFIDADGIAYVHIPVLVISSPDAAMIYFTDLVSEEFTDDELKNAIKQYVAEKERAKLKRASS